MPPDRVPLLLRTRLLEISMLCPQPWTRMPPPPWELLVIMKPSIRDGLHWKLLGNGLATNLRSPGLFLPQSLAVRRAVPVGYPASAPTPNQSVPAGTRTPLASTVIP